VLNGKKLEAGCLKLEVKSPVDKPGFLLSIQPTLWLCTG
jgi:hypothetical protein